MSYATQPRDKAGRFVSDKTYYQLKEEERARGFVRPLRQTYTHARCGEDTTIVSVLAENFARFPTLNNQAYCSTCNKVLPVTEFVWKGTKETVGS